MARDGKSKLFENLDDETLRRLGYDPDRLDLSEKDKRKKSDYDGEVSEKAFLKARYRGSVRMQQKHDKKPSNSVSYSIFEIMAIDYLRKQRKDNKMTEEKKVPKTLYEIILQTIIDVCAGKYSDWLIDQGRIKEPKDLIDDGGIWILTVWISDYIEATYWSDDRSPVRDQISRLGKVYKEFSEEWFPLFTGDRNASGTDAKGDRRSGKEYQINPSLVAEVAQTTFSALKKAPADRKAKFDELKKQQAATAQDDQVSDEKSATEEAPADDSAEEVKETVFQSQPGSVLEDVDITVEPEGKVRIRLKFRGPGA
jgi:hypothetical protein